MGARGRGSFFAKVFRHSTLIAVEAVLVANVFKDFVFERVRAGDMPGYAKVLFVMAATVGLFAGLFVLLEKLLKRGVTHTHDLLRALPVALPTLLIHAALLLLLFLLYARMLRISVF
jgi:hypothetical protein